MPKIFFNYVITPNKELLISSYHEPVQALSNARQLMGPDNFKQVTKWQEEVPSPGDEKEIKATFCALLTKIEKEFDTLTVKCDLNICTKDKQPAIFLFDGTL